MKSIGVYCRARLGKQELFEPEVRLERHRWSSPKSSIGKVHIVDAVGLEFQAVVHTSLAHDRGHTGEGVI